jgi:hypothetical protein
MQNITSILHTSPNMSQATSSQALYNFRLLSALRSDDASQVQAFIDEAEGDPTRSGALLGTAVKVGTSGYPLRRFWTVTGP